MIMATMSTADCGFSHNVMESAKIDGPATVWQGRKNVRHPMTPNDLIGQIGSPGVDRGHERLVQAAQNHQDFRLFRQQALPGRR